MKNKYTLLEVNYVKALKDMVVVIIITLFFFVFSVLNDRQYELQLLSGGLLFLALITPMVQTFRNKVVIVTTSENGLIVKEKASYKWEEISSVNSLEMRLQILAAPTPGYVLHFYDGNEVIIDQRLNGYTNLYHELYQHKIEGSEKPLYLYETNMAGSSKSMSRKYHSVYYPENDQIVRESGIA
ncbi:hypothetical protein ACFSJY_03210 [Thalassotalea euphylliae]|uniref:hypothetical protein n=1 Tax=Thalassotalea euphylliae TaxID=1655234 RepID=UPI00363AFEA8